MRKYVTRRAQMATGKINLVRVDANLIWQIRQYKDGGYLAICDPIGITIEGETMSELMEEISSTLDAMLRNLLKTNDLDRFMREHGWKILGRIPTPKRDIRFDVPFFTEKMKGHGSQRSLN